MQNRPSKMILPGMSFPQRTAPRACGPELAWRRVRAISGLFTLLVALVMLVGHLSTDAIDPLKSPDLKALKEKLRANPVDEQTKIEIRRLDLQLRARYFRQLSQSSYGVYLLLAGAGVFLFAVAR